MTKIGINIAHQIFMIKKKKFRLKIKIGLRVQSFDQSNGIKIDSAVWTVETIHYGFQGLFNFLLSIFKIFVLLQNMFEL